MTTGQGRHDAAPRPARSPRASAAVAALGNEAAAAAPNVAGVWKLVGGA